MGGYANNHQKHLKRCIKISYFSTTPLTEIQASSAALAKWDCGCAILTNSAKSATLHRVSDNSSKISTIGRDGPEVASSIRRSVADIACSFKTWKPSNVTSSGLLKRPWNREGMNNSKILLTINLYEVGSKSELTIKQYYNVVFKYAYHTNILHLKSKKNFTTIWRIYTIKLSTYYNYSSK